jgi:hypothetical protein
VTARPGHAGDERDFLERLARRYAPLDNGDYVVEIHPPSTAPFARGEYSGLRLGLRIREGEHAERVIVLRLTLDGPRSAEFFIARNLSALRAWADGVGAPPAPDTVGLAKALRNASRGFRVTVSLATRKTSAGFDEISIQTVRCSRLAGLT